MEGARRSARRQAPKEGPGGAWREVGKEFRRLARLLPDAGRLLVLVRPCPDALAAGALLRRALRRPGRTIRVEALPRGSGFWDAATIERVRAVGPALVLALAPEEPPAASLPWPVVVVDSEPLPATNVAASISGAGIEPRPSLSVLAFWLAQAAGDARALDWVAAAGAMASQGDNSSQPLVIAAKRAYGGQWLREVVVLLKAASRAPEDETVTVMRLLGQARDPRDCVVRPRPERDRLIAVRDEVEAAISAAKAATLLDHGTFRLVPIATPCGVHPLIAWIWNSRQDAEPVLVANTGYLAGWVSFASVAAPSTTWQAQLLTSMPASAVLERPCDEGLHLVVGRVAVDDWPVWLRSLGDGRDR